MQMIRTHTRAQEGMQTVTLIENTRMRLEPNKSNCNNSKAFFLASEKIQMNRIM